jgi:hypothetical protein
MNLRDTVSVVRAPLIAGPYGTQIRNWAGAITATYAAQVSPESSIEVVGDEARTVTRWRLFAGPDADIQATDRVVWDDGGGLATYEVDGQVMRSHQKGSLHHVRCRLRLITTTVG